MTISIVMLSQKAIDHCRNGLLLMPFASLDAAILLRAAYEATVIAQYLTRNPDQLDDSHLHADLIKLRNQHEALVFAEDEATRSEQQSYISKVQQEILGRYAAKNRQIAHSGRDVMLSHYYYRSEQPLYSLYSLYRQIIHLTNANILLLANSGIVRRGERHEQLFTILKILLDNAPGGPISD